MNHEEMHKRFIMKFGNLTFDKFELFIESEIERERERIVDYIDGEKTEGQTFEEQVYNSALQLIADYIKGDI